jgi:hypothetical protein
VTIMQPAIPALPNGNRTGQGTVVEQSRAIAEVQAAVVVAQQMPRDIDRAVREMQRSCGQKSLAEKAFFRFPRGKDPDTGKTLYVSGPSVQVARELARCFGNLQYGIVELRRDDGYGQSEMLAFAWDLETNTRSSTTFIVPHIRDTKKGSQALVDQRDIYENNANNGARRLREMIFAILPGWYTEDAIGACYQTLNADVGDGEEREQRLAVVITRFGEMGVTERQLTQKIGAPKERWTPYDITQLGVIYRSIQRGELNKEDEFPASSSQGGRVAVTDITSAQQSTGPQPPERPANGKPAPAPEPPKHAAPAKATSGQVSMIGREWERLGYGEADAEEMLVFTARLAQVDTVGPVADLTQDQAKAVHDKLTGFADRPAVVAYLYPEGGESA